MLASSLTRENPRHGKIEVTIDRRGMRLTFFAGRNDKVTLVVREKPGQGTCLEVYLASRTRPFQGEPIDVVELYPHRLFRPEHDAHPPTSAMH